MHRPEIVDHPELLAEDPKLAAQSAIWFWTTYTPGLRRHAQKGEWAKVRNGVNGGNIGKKDFDRALNRYLNGTGILLRR